MLHLHNTFNPISQLNLIRIVERSKGQRITSIEYKLFVDIDVFILSTSVQGKLQLNYSIYFITTFNFMQFFHDVSTPQ